jgi:hypothetical protein
MNEVTPPPRRGRSRLVLGIILLTLGVALLALNLGVNLPWHLWKYFPIPLIALGIWGLASPSRHLDRVGGVWLLATGLYCLIGIFGLFDLGWSTAWPVFIVATGISVMIPGESGACTPHKPKANGDE